MKYKLVVLDLDGTLTNSKKEITARNRETLIRIQEQGVRLVLASGRPTYGIVPLANELRMNEFGGFILSYNGGEIINWKSKEMMYENVLPNEVIPVLYECARTNHLSILTYDGAEIVTENSQDPYVQKEAFLNKMAVRETNDFLTDITLPVAKCLIVESADQCQSVHPAAAAGPPCRRRRPDRFHWRLWHTGLDCCCTFAGGTPCGAAPSGRGAGSSHPVPSCGYRRSGCGCPCPASFHRYDFSQLLWFSG